MTERERLIELLRNQNCPNPMLCDKNCKYAHLESCYKDRTADWLLSNGVIVPPCKVGDTVYTNFAMQGWYFRDKCRPYSAKVVFMGLNNSEEMGGGLINVLYNKGENMLQFRFSDIGKIVFLTREEAEKALKKRSEEE
jgi:hypothetical protein